MTSLFFHFGKNIVAIFSGYNFFAHLLAIVSTYILVVSGIDWVYFVEAPKYLSRDYFFPAIFLGSLLPFVVPILLYPLGKVFKKEEVVNLAFAVAQSAMLGSLISSFYKSLTGRIPPTGQHYSEIVTPGSSGQTLIDTSQGFRFGFWEGGIFWGWPSSHTTIAFAMAVTFAILMARKTKWAYLALLYAFYVGIAISFTIHWLSEFVAGAIIGTIIGVVVAKSFEKRLASRN